MCLYVLWLPNGPLFGFAKSTKLGFACQQNVPVMSHGNILETYYETYTKILAGKKVETMQKSQNNNNRVEMTLNKQVKQQHGVIIIG